MIEKLLYATNFEKPSFVTLEGLLELCKLGLKEVVLLNTTNFSEWEKLFSQHNINAKVLSEKEFSGSRILSIAERENASFIIAHLEKGQKRLLGSPTIKYLIKKSTIPVMIFPKVPTNKRWFEHIILATDWSPSSENALSYILNFKEIIKELDIVHIIDEKLTIRDLREIKDKLAKIRKVCLQQGLDAEFHLYAGKIDEEIIRAAKDYQGSAIVIGAPSKSGLREVFWGSPCYKVTEEAHIPVLVIPRTGG